MSDSQSVWSRLDGPMTPALVADIRAETEQMGSPIARRVLALADSLDAAWAALERAEAELLSAQVLLEGSTNRAERAEQEKRATAAERDMWQTSHGVLGKRCQEHEARAFRAEAALTRLKAARETCPTLCDDCWNAALDGEAGQ